jgi:Na+/proline symporter
MSSGSATIAVRSCYIAAGLYLTIAMLPLFISLCTKHLYPEQLQGDAQLALPNMVLTHTSMHIQILFFGSLLSAIMSTTSSALLAPASIFSENLIKPLVGDRLNDKQFLLITKVSVLGFGVIGTVMALVRSNIYELVGESSILSLVSLFIPLVFGLYWKRANALGALLSMGVGLASWIYFEVYPIENIPSLVPALVISFIGMVVGSLLNPNKKK